MSTDGVGNAVGKVDNAAFRRTRLAPAGMADNAAEIMGEINSFYTIIP